MFSAQEYKSLLHHKDFAIVQEGLFLLEDILGGCSLDELLQQIKELVGVDEKGLFDVKGLLQFYRQKDIFFDFHHGNYLAVWALGFLARFEELQEELPQELDISFPIGQGLSALPRSIANITTLQKLDLSGNVLARDLWSGALPEELGQLQGLVYLNLSCNDLVEVPAVVCRLVNLSVLSLRGNQLLTLPESIHSLTKLTTLNVKGNQLSVLPEEVGDLSSLVELSLQRNKLSTLPESIGRLEKLRYLDLRQNSFSEEEKQRIRSLLPSCKIHF